MTAPPKGEPLAGRARCAVRTGPIGRKAPGPVRMGSNALTKGAWQTAVNLNRGARSFPDAKNFARPARSLPARQWLPYQGSWREAPERLYHMPRFRSVSWLPEGNPSYNLSVTFGDTSPGRRGFGIAQTSSLRQWSSSLCRYLRHLPPAGGSLSYQGSWQRVSAD